jgi:hypothetical protein
VSKQQRRGLRATGALGAAQSGKQGRSGIAGGRSVGGIWRHSVVTERNEGDSANGGHVWARGRRGVQREMVGEFARLDHTQRVELGRKAIKNYHNRVRNRMKTQQATVEIPTQAEQTGKCKGMLREMFGPRKTPRTRAQTAQAESVASTSAGALTVGRAGVEVATQAEDTDGVSWVKLAQELHRVKM